MSGTAARFQPGAQLVLDCRPGKAAGHLVFTYRVENRGVAGALVMDAMTPRARPGQKQPGPPNDQVATVLFAEDGSALVGKVLPPLPTDRAVIAVAPPLCILLSPGEGMERELRLPLPFAEGNPYLPDLTLRQYAPAAVAAVVLAIGWWPEDLPGLHAAPLSSAPDFHLVSPPAGHGKVPLATRRFPTNGLEILRRLDSFPRILTSHRVV
ncbi:hypothetical protein [Roseomonas sp. BN140053]|uniref:hypothetical protein n=1 Tax=Roseomonas sp. BN140053 TaxID=3391898 RepID=UPI0039E91ADA